MKYILAIDPGTVQSAFVLWDADRKEIADKGIVPNETLLAMLSKFGGEGTDVVIEMVASYGMAVGKEVFETCVWIGRFSQVSLCPVHLIYRREVKMCLCGNMKAKDANIRQALIDLLGKDVCKGVSKDMWSALALAITYVSSIVETEKVCKIAEEAGL